MQCITYRSKQPHKRTSWLVRWSFTIAICMGLLLIPGFGLQAQGQTLVSAGSGSGNVGDSINIDINVENPSGMVGGSFNIYYNPKVVKPTGVTAGEVLQGCLFVPNPNYQNNGQSGVRIVWAGTTAANQDGCLCTITFEILAGGQSSLTLKDVSLKDINTQTIAVNTTGGKITVDTGKSTTATERPDTNSQIPPAHDYTGTTQPLTPAPEKQEAGQIVSFNDITDHWAKDSITKLSGMKIISGYPDGNFYPNKEITRAEFAVIIARSLNISAAGTQNLSFSDKDTIPVWAQKYIAAALQADIISGYQDGSFRPAENISRVEMAVMISRAMKKNVSATPQLNFTDASRIPSWAAGYVQAAVDAGVISGLPDGTFQANALATRAQSAAMICRMLGLK